MHGGTLINLVSVKHFRSFYVSSKEGKIKHIGLSEVSVEELKKAQQYFKVVSVQNRYSVDNRRWESVLNYTKEQHMAFIPWYPLSAGNVAVLDKHKTIPLCP